MTVNTKITADAKKIGQANTDKHGNIIVTLTAPLLDSSLDDAFKELLLGEDNQLHKSALSMCKDNKPHTPAAIILNLTDKPLLSSAMHDHIIELGNQARKRNIRLIIANPTTVLAETLTNKAKATYETEPFEIQNNLITTISSEAKPDTQLGNSGATIIPPDNVHEYMNVV